MNRSLSPGHLARFYLCGGLVLASQSMAWNAVLILDLYTGVIAVRKLLGHTSPISLSLTVHNFLFSCYLVLSSRALLVWAGRVLRSAIRYARSVPRSMMFTAFGVASSHVSPQYRPSRENIFTSCLSQCQVTTILVPCRYCCFWRRLIVTCP
ncbi:hypothetical protein BS47DRAFT_1164481 [Hydnum rufescens UP504]|uniref:Uncharacterized protein n=1 Tax=Hydnum rufescens UP504 TaxID=1448309 RepID=A0A9P6AT42_9AGAM|nr:hypothetical protein BS47DRAFT_1164481 [Hydnum rufescens UP504]